MAADERLVNSYLALEKIALAGMNDEQRVQWFQQRTISAEEANRELLAEKDVADVVTRFPAIDAADLLGVKSKPEMEALAARLTAKVEKASKAGQEIVEAAVKDALKIKDEEIVEMRKVYGKPRQPQAGDVTGSGAAATAAAATVGIGTGAPEKIELGTMEAVGRVAQRAAEPLFGILGLREKA